MIRFIKAHGLGNDFVILDCLEQPRLAHAPLDALARAMCDRRRGVGADQLLTLEPPSPDNPAASVRMRVFNADGGEAEMCGNGVRCVARLATERGHAGPEALIETRAGVRACATLPDGTVRVVMGRPRFEPEASGLDPRVALAWSERRGPVTMVELEGVRGGLVRMGTPNFVAFADTPVSIAFVSMRGAAIETHAAFPARLNAQFATRLAPDGVAVRTWERGAGLTEACGTGACAVFAVGRALGLLDHEATLALPGGELRVAESPAGDVLMTGPAMTVFHGEWAL